MEQGKPFVEYKIDSGETVLFDAEHMDRVKLYKWRLVIRRGKKHVLTRSRGHLTNAFYLGRLLFEYNRKKQMVAFRNGNRLDFRSENVEIVQRVSHLRNTKTFTEKAGGHFEFRLNGCVITEAPEDTRCTDYQSCPHAMDCLDLISHKTIWEGWKAAPAA